MASCPLCEPDAENVLWRDARCRVVLVDDPDYVGYCRVIWAAHVKEMSDLNGVERGHLFDVVLAVESLLRERLQPTKINLASLGNQVPHLHWHVIPRFSDDAHFPDPIWATRKRSPPPRDVDVFRLAQALAAMLSRQA